MAGKAKVLVAKTGGYGPPQEHIRVLRRGRERLATLSSAWDSRFWPRITKFALWGRAAAALQGRPWSGSAGALASSLEGLYHDAAGCRTLPGRADPQGPPGALSSAYLTIPGHFRQNVSASTRSDTAARRVFQTHLIRLGHSAGLSIRPPFGAALPLASVRRQQVGGRRGCDPGPCPHSVLTALELLVRERAGIRRLARCDQLPPTSPRQQATARCPEFERPGDRTVRDGCSQ